jgi:hypothetical protein
MTKQLTQLWRPHGLEHLMERSLTACVAAVRYVNPKQAS